MQANFVTIICGDFNIIETPVAKVGNWLLGAPIKEGLPWYNERVIFEKLFKSLSLQNPLSKKGTYKYFNNQLDHILVPENWKVKKAEVIKNSHGSDHYPIFVEIDIL
jgi:endonuclease/exonuclease/phosphatase family metal-dependent hydrolase